MLSQLLVVNEIISITDALIYALIGFAFVFVGIGVLIGILYLIGFIMQKTNGSVSCGKRKEKREKQESTVAAPVSVSGINEDVPDEVKAAIIAAIMAYYNEENPKCEFVVRKIKRI